MLPKLLLAALVAASAAVPAVAKDGDRTAICHRTGAKAIEGYFPGHVIEVSDTSLAEHIPGHRDVILTPEAKQALGGRPGKKAVCLTDAGGNVFDASGKLVQSGAGGGDPGGPG